MISKKLLGDAVKQERLRRNLSQNALAERAQISLRTISDIENYNANPRLETICMLASFLDFSLDAIIYDKEQPLDTTTKQILMELEGCSDETKRLALGTLQGLLAAIAKENTKEEN